MDETVYSSRERIRLYSTNDEVLRHQSSQVSLPSAANCASVPAYPSPPEPWAHLQYLHHLSAQPWLCDKPPAPAVRPHSLFGSGPSPLARLRAGPDRTTTALFTPFNVGGGPTLTSAHELRSWQPAAPLEECIPFLLRGTLSQRHAALSPAGKTTAHELHFLTAASLPPVIEPSQRPAPGSVQIAKRRSHQAISRLPPRRKGHEYAWTPMMTE